MKLNDLFICTVYIPPENSNYFEDDILLNIHNDMLQLQDENSKFVMVGDFNTRTSNLPDVNNESGNQFINFQSLNSQVTIKRNNFDGEVSKHGNRLLDLCKSTQLQIVNGRKQGNSLGRYTCFTPNGGVSTVDYCISDEIVFEIIKTFAIKKQTIFSNHCQIILLLETKCDIFSKTNNSDHNYTWHKLPPGFKWDKKSEKFFKQTLVSPKFRDQIENFLKCDFNHNHKDADKACKLVHSMFLEAAKASCKLKANKVRSRSLKNKRWFDKECSNKRKEVRKLANRKHRDPGNMHLRNEHNTLVKEFKNVCKVKESLFWKSKMGELTNKYHTNDF